MPRDHNKPGCTGHADDFLDSLRGYIGALSPAAIHGVRAASAASQSRQSQLAAMPGLFEVVPGIYQVRDIGLSNMTLVEGAEGVIVLGPPVSTECAAAALALYRAHRGQRQVTAVIYPDSHVDHFAGVRGVISDSSPGPVGGPPVLASASFLDQVALGGVHGASLGGAIGLVPPTIEVTATGQEEKADGVRMTFQLTPAGGLNVFFPGFFPGQALLCLACRVLGADTRALARSLTETIGVFAERADVVAGSHHWPVWGRDRVVAFLSSRRDAYAYLHDQTVRLVNRGYRPAEIERTLLARSPEPPGHTVRRYPGPAVADIVAALSARQLFDALAVQLDGQRAAGARRLIGVELTDRGEFWTLLLAHGVLTAIAGPAPGGEEPDLVVALARPVLDALITGRARAQDPRIALSGDPAALTALLSLLSLLAFVAAVVTAVAQGGPVVCPWRRHCRRDPMADLPRARLPGF